MTADPAGDQTLSSASQIRIQFTTQQPGISLPENNGPVLVPTSLRRYGLSSLVNHLLGNEKPTPFDFLASGTFLRNSVDKYLTEHGLSSESVLTLEYVPSIIPPLFLASYEHDDWVSSVDVLSGIALARQNGNHDTARNGHERILSGSYDGLLRVWNTSAEVIATSSTDGGYLAGIKCAKFLSSSRVVSGALDRTVRIWELDESKDDGAAEMKTRIELYGHRHSIDDIAVHAPSSRILSASADHAVGLWSARKSDAPAAPAELVPSATSRSKKRRTSSADHAPQRGPLAMLQSHTAPVSAVIFAPTDATVAYSTSWDHSLRTWDLPTSSLVSTRTTSHSLFSLAALPSLNLLAAGTSARHITLIDPRASATSVSAMTLRGHTNAVVSLANDPASAFGLVSGSHDGTCRVWDVRSTKPGRPQDSGGAPEGAVGESVYTIERESIKSKGKRVGGDGVKVFSVVWDAELGIVSGSEDKTIQINKGQGVMPVDSDKAS